MPNTNSVSLAGEFAVLSQLAVRGYEASLTLGNTKSIDILVYDPKTDTSRQLEVKTNFERRNGPSNSRFFGRFISKWRMGKKHESIVKPNLFYCFVHIFTTQAEPEKNRFRFFVVPSSVVAEYVREQHASWLLDDPNHKDTDMRVFRIGLHNETDVPMPAPLGDLYEDNWEQIASPATEVVPE